ncbi:RNA methyltransferase [bacterium]|nr:RNA methyltransferase [bacterium]
MEITSANNDLVKDFSKLKEKKYRDKTGKFILEGYKAVEGAISSNIEIEKIFLLNGKNFSFDKNKIIYTNETVLKKISTTTTPPEIIAIGKQKRLDLTDLKTVKRAALFENINDLGNLGTILRTAAATDLDAIILYGNTVDIYNPKCVRASVGNLWKTPVYNIKDINILKKYFNDFDRISTLPASTDTVNLKNYKTKEKTLVMFGAESTGLSEELIDFSTTKLTIEMKNNVESLNLSISAGIVLYKLFLL